MINLKFLSFLLTFLFMLTSSSISLAEEFWIVKQEKQDIISDDYIHYSCLRWFPALDNERKYYECPKVKIKNQPEKKCKPFYYTTSTVDDPFNSIEKCVEALRESGLCDKSFLGPKVYCVL